MSATVARIIFMSLYFFLKKVSIKKGWISVQINKKKMTIFSACYKTVPPGTYFFKKLKY